MLHIPTSCTFILYTEKQEESLWRVQTWATKLFYFIFLTPHRQLGSGLQASLSARRASLCNQQGTCAASPLPQPGHRLDNVVCLLLLLCIFWQLYLADYWEIFIQLYQLLAIAVATCSEVHWADEFPCLLPFLHRWNSPTAWTLSDPLGHLKP